MTKILGTGTNSLGWAILTKEENGEYKLHEHGTNIFTEGVKIEKGIESSKAAEHTNFVICAYNIGGGSYGRYVSCCVVG